MHRGECFDWRRTGRWDGTVAWPRGTDDGQKSPRSQLPATGVNIVTGTGSSHEKKPPF